MDEDRKFPIAYIGESFDYKLRDGRYFDGEFDSVDIVRGVTDLIHATVLAVSTNHFTSEYVYKIRSDHIYGEVDEAWYTEDKVLKMKGTR